MNQSLNKAGQIFEILMQSEGAIGVNEFARLLSIPKSTVSRFLSTLESLGFVRRDRESGKFYLGLKLFELGCKAIEDMGLRQIALPEMEKLRDAINENVFLTVLEDTHITYLDKIESLQAVVIQANVGGTAPAYCVSSGKAMLAFSPRRLERVIESGLTRYTPRTIVDPAALRAECAEIREQGYALNRGEFREEVFGVAAPIFNAWGEAVGAISTAAPASRMNKKRWKEHIEGVTRTTRLVSRALGAVMACPP